MDAGCSRDRPALFYPSAHRIRRRNDLIPRTVLGIVTNRAVRGQWLKCKSRGGGTVHAHLGHCW